MVLAGFSQGAAVAIHLALNGAVPARAFFAVAPAVRDRDELLTLLARPPDPALRGYVILGGRDFWAEAFDPIRRALLDGPIPCQLETHRDLDHAFPAPFGPSLALGLGFLGAQE